MKVLKKFSVGIISVLLLAAMAGVFTACPGTTTEDPPDSLSWTLEEFGGVNGTTDSAGVVIKFSGEVTALAASEVTVSGAASPGTTAPYQNTTGINSWTVPITVTSAGMASIQINKSGIEAGPKEVKVHKAGTPTAVTWTVTADGTADKSTTNMSFTFDEPVTLQATDITITGEALSNTGYLIGSGTEWAISIGVKAAGELTVAINNSVIKNESKNVTVFYKPPANPLAPRTPVILKLEDSVYFNDMSVINNAASVTAALADPTQTKASLVLSWEGIGADTYNLYVHTENTRPATPQITNITGTSYFIKEGIEKNETYFVWVEAKNQHGTAVSASRSRDTRDEKIERGDYPRNLKFQPGDGSVTVWWDMPDRVGWHEIYYVKAGEIKHVDAYTPIKFKWDQLPFTDKTSYKDSSNLGWTVGLYPYESPLVSGTWRGYNIGRNSETDSGPRPVIGINDFGKTETDSGYNPTFASYPPKGAFPYVFEGWKEGDIADDNNNLGKLQPYTQLDSAFATATPWDGTQAGTPGTPIPYYKNSVTITGLTNGQEYEIWIRVPNVNGERGYGYVLATPGSSGLSAVANVTVTAPAGSTRDLEIKWDAAKDGEGTEATGYRLYFSDFNEAPTTYSSYTYVAAANAANYTVTRTGLLSNTPYYVSVVAEKNGLAGPMGSVAEGMTGMAPSTGIKGKVKTIPGTSHEVKTLIYVEVNDNNPLNAGSYILEDGSYLFDYVVLFAGNIRTRNCAAETGQTHGCTMSGPHLHLNENVRHIVTNADKYIRPLQDKGIKVLMGVLPDHDGVSLGSMNAADTATFVAHLKSEIDRYGLDGVDLDDEWGSKEEWGDNGANWVGGNPPASSIWVYPISEWYWPFRTTVYRDPNKGIEAGNGTLTPNTPAQQERMWNELGVGTYKTIDAIRTALGPNKIITLYEYNTGRYVTAGGANPVDTSITSSLLAGKIDFALNAMYNQYIPDSFNKVPRAKYGSLAMDVSGIAYAAQNGAPNPPMNTTGNNSITDYATQFRNAANANNPYGYICLYGLTRASSLLKNDSGANTPYTVAKEKYLSIMTEIVFGKETVLTAEGGDYAKDW